MTRRFIEAGKRVLVSCVRDKMGEGFGLTCRQPIRPLDLLEEAIHQPQLIERLLRPSFGLQDMNDLLSQRLDDLRRFDQLTDAFACRLTRRVDGSSTQTQLRSHQIDLPTLLCAHFNHPANRISHLRRLLTRCQSLLSALAAVLDLGHNEAARIFDFFPETRASRNEPVCYGSDEGGHHAQDCRG